MRKRIALWLTQLAKWVYPQKEFSSKRNYVPKKLGVRYQVTNSDIKEYIKRHPKCSRRKAVHMLVEHTKKEIATNIFAGIYKHHLIDYVVSSTLFSAEVTGELYIYESEKDQEDDC